MCVNLLLLWRVLVELVYLDRWCLFLLWLGFVQLLWIFGHGTLGPGLRVPSLSGDGQLPVVEVLLLAESNLPGD